MIYNPEEYWEERGRTYIPKQAQPGEKDYLVACLQETAPKSLLEVGSGWGRVYRWLRDAEILPERYTMCDFVDSMRAGCFKETDIWPDRWDGRTLPYSDGSYEIVITFSVLQHILPEHIGQVFQEIVRVSSRWIFLAEWIGEWYRVFPHDYIKLFMTNRLYIDKAKTLGFTSKGQKVHWLLRK